MTPSKLKRFALRSIAPAGAILMLTVMSNYGAETATLDSSAREFKTPQDLEYKSRPGATIQTATPFGDPSKPGMYVQVLKRDPNSWTKPHMHPNDRYITVVSGTMKVGTGDKFDKENTVSLGPGSVVRDIAHHMHYDGAGPEGAIIVITGMGPAQD